MKALKRLVSPFLLIPLATGACLLLAASTLAKAEALTAPQTGLHYTSGSNLDADGHYTPGKLGFNLADVSSVSQLNSLPAGVKGLVWLGLCNGADAKFISAVRPYIGNPGVFGFYLMDEPDPTGRWGKLCSAANLKAESDWIHTNAPGVITFIVLMNMGTDTKPSFANTYNPTNTGIDLYGLDPYPCKKALSNGCDYSVIGVSVTAAVSSGIPLDKIVPVYQAFGGGGYAAWTMPTARQEQEILAKWAEVVPHPVFDMVYAWGSQHSDTSLERSPAQQAVFAEHNRGERIGK